MPNIAVLTDFDATATTINVLDSLYAKFAEPSYAIHMERWNRGEISTMEELERVFSTVSATRNDMEVYLRTFALDPGFKSLITYCREQDYPFAIVSDGLRWYIDYILANYGIIGVKVFAGEIYFENRGFRFEYPWFDPEYPFRSTAKPAIIRDYQKRGYKVVFIGDGLSDVEAAGVADVVYAKDVLLQQARKRGFTVQEYKDLNDVLLDLIGYGESEQSV
jgi:2-hydroxy-3-keto-5-methylthiopentenyl-1-phosphate phosphatase